MNTMPVVDLCDGQAKAVRRRWAARIDVHPLRRLERSMQPDAVVEAREIERAARRGIEDVRSEAAEIDELVGQVGKRRHGDRLVVGQRVPRPDPEAKARISVVGRGLARQIHDPDVHAGFRDERVGTERG